MSKELELYKKFIVKDLQEEIDRRASDDEGSES